MFNKTTALQKIISLNKRIRAVAGGTAASKTISILMWLIQYGQTTQNKIVTVVSESYPHLEGGVIRDFKAILIGQRYWKDSAWNDSKHIYTFPGGTQIEFRAIDKFGKAHGPRRDVLFLNEANNIDYAIADQLITRTREVVWLDWNPSTEFWFYSEMKGKRDDVDFITLTYLDNEALDENTLNEILAHKNNKSWWTVYGLGQLGEVEGLIYKGWQVIDDIPHEARIIRTGLDFGYTNDESAIVDVYYHNNGYILDEILYRKGMQNDKLADVLNYKERQALVIADSAEPKSIDELKATGSISYRLLKAKDR
jgi:phage terminase large subunit